MERLSGERIADLLDGSFKKGEFDPVVSRVEENLLRGFIESDGGGFSNTPEGFVRFFEAIRNDIESCEGGIVEITEATKKISITSLNRRAEILSSGAMVEFQRNLSSKEARRNVSKWNLMLESITKPALALSSQARVFDK